MIGEILKKIRNIYGYKASELSKKLGISQSFLSEIENNKKQPSLELLKKYSEIYEIKLSSLILLSENLETEQQQSKIHNNVFIRNMMINFINKMASDNKIE
ncbi:MAG TPA: helix-turn-helix transcriptional regulator [Candidatus Avacidaminococcus intestinavium]|uniref:Helix-turn-helix transcriptional regulator n=1 Tax=Candidatus Avacidaminococcus intestinavium TaxID=2840684 RepID=A0A9D1MNT2_9FIRM|nr:helix-turn-helix transcriptional regulator [Candidatus Avacidaminococcus intestinavium]